jgi:RHS repeat-associated protein
MKRSLFFVIALLSFAEAIAQTCPMSTFCGPSSVTVGQSVTYTISSDGVYSPYTFTIVGGVEMSKSRSAMTYTVVVTWNSVGAGRITFDQDGGSLAVTVTGTCNYTSPQTPTGLAFSVGSLCGTAQTVSYSGTPPTGYTWYWQTSATGTSMAALNSGTSFSVSTSGVYYVRARSNCSDTWSSAAASPTVTVNSLPAEPTSVTNIIACPLSSFTLAGTPGANADNLKWYWGSSGGTAIATGKSVIYNEVEGDYVSSMTFYASSVNTTTGCESSTRKTLTVTLKATPPIPTSVASGLRCGSGAVTLGAVVSGTGNSARWYGANWSLSPGTPLLGTGSSFTTASLSATTTFYVRTYNSTTLCESYPREVIATVNPIPTVAASNQNVFTGSTTSINLTNPNNVSGTTYTWTASATNVSGAGSGSGVTIAQVLTNISPNSNGVVTYTITPTAGSCSGIPVSATVTVSPMPTVTIIGTPVVALGGSVTLQANTKASGPLTYQWVKGGIAIPGATASNYLAKEPGEYFVRVTATTMAASAPVTIYATGLQPDNTTNAVVTTIVRKSGVTSSTNLYTSLQPGDYSQSVIYTDELGRPTQSIAVAQSPLQNDIILPYAYDTLVPISYLPYVASTRNGSKGANALAGAGGSYTTSDQYLFYQQATTKIATSLAPYSKIVCENSPLKRVIEQGAPGVDWQTGTPTQLGQNTNKSEFHTNAANDVKIWTSNGPGGFYIAGSLAVNKTINQNGNSVFTFTDKMGRTVLKRVQMDATVEGTYLSFLETYYVYDAQGNVILQVPPKAIIKLNSGTAWSQAFSDQWCFAYTYDFRGRLKTKKAPGIAATYYAYDPLGRLTLVQDGNLRVTNKWMFIKYDIKGRPIMTGLYTNATQTSLMTVQDILNGLYTDTNAYYEDRGTALHGYTNQSFPVSNKDNSALEILVVNYYDNYDFDNVGGDDYSYTAQGMAGEATQGNSLGFITGNKRLVLGTNTWLYTYTFYDRFNRPIQIRGNNYLSSAIDNLTTVVYDFEGKRIQTKTYHNAGGTNQTTVVNKFTYDHAGRLLKVYQNNNSAPSDQLLAQYSYNELGQMVDKKLHDAGGNNFLQSVDYRYNIHGWLQSINNAQLTNDSGATNDDTNDYFGMELLYNTTDAGLVNNKYFNGNISAIKWKATGPSGATDQRSYKLVYDKNDKLLTSTFQANNGTSWGKETNTLNENISYDANGNILTMKRNQDLRGLTGITVTSTPQAIDDLTYTYAMGNQLSKVEDAVSIGIGKEDFKNGSSQSTEYTYDSNGNTLTEANKGISSIVYNVLGKAQQINFTDGRVIVYKYDGVGTKLRMATTVNGTTTTTDYSGGFVYTNGSLSFFSSPEGRVVKNGSALEYQYSIADHQGNTRVVFTSATPVVQTFTATYEDAAQVSESQPSYLQNYPSGSAINPVTSNSHSGTKSQYLNGGYAGMVGVTKAFKVYPGDKVQIDAYARYSAPTSNNSSLASFAGALLSAFSLPSPVSGEVGTASSGINTWGGLEAGGFANGSGNNSFPKAFVNIIMFDKNHNFLDVAYSQVTSSGAPGFLTASYTAKEEGYAYLYISNEQPTQTDVYFDDVRMSFTPTKVIQYNEYYPYGLQTAKSWTRTNTSNNFLYNGGVERNNTTGWYETAFRGYDAALGRFGQVDPHADRYASFSPYNYANNNPILLNDPMGLDATGQKNMDHLFSVQRAVMSDVYGYGADGGYDKTDGGGGSSGARGSSTNYGCMTEAELIALARQGDGLAAREYAIRHGAESYVFDSDGVTGIHQLAYAGDDGTIYAGLYFTKNDKIVAAITRESVPGAEGGYVEVPGGNQVMFFAAEIPKGIDPNALDPSTIGHNLLWLSYPGGNNPRSYNGQYNYSYLPKSRAEYPAIGHDRRYDNLGTAGAKGLLTDTRAIGADWLFVVQEFSIALDLSNSFEDRVNAQILGIGLGLAATTKTIYQLIVDPYAIPLWFGISNEGVTNIPSDY